MTKILSYDEYLNEIDRIDVIIGGKGDKKVATDVDPNELAVGIEVEREEHSENSDISAEEIALDHLEEDPKYYSKLIQADLVDEPEALRIAKELLGIEPKNTVK